MQNLFSECSNRDGDPILWYCGGPVAAVKEGKSYIISNEYTGEYPVPFIDKWLKDLGYNYDHAQIVTPETMNAVQYNPEKV